MGKKVRKGDDSEWRNMTLAKPKKKEPEVKNESEVDETILKLAGVYK